MNEPLSNWGLLAALFVATVALGATFTALFRRYALNRSVMDIPNSRSSHTAPVPRGGGMSIALLVTVIAFAVGVYLQDGFVLSASLAGALVALVGWFDDHRPLKAIYRLLVHFVAVAVMVFQLPEFGLNIMGLEFPGWTVRAGLLLVGVWFTNLYNFIDGIDGIAGSHALLFGVWAAGLFWLAHVSVGALLAATIAGASLGFLIHNWPPARVFMGDGGSGFLGFWFFVLWLYAGLLKVTPLIAMPLCVLAVDATMTLLWRMVRGERWYTAHREHAYQKLVRIGFSHGSVTLAYLIVSGLMASVALGLTNTSLGLFRSIVLVTMVLLICWVGVQWATTTRLKDRE